MQQGGDVQDQFVPRVEAVLPLQAAEKLLRQVGDMQGVRFVELVAAAEFNGRTDDLLAEVGGPDVRVDRLAEETIAQVGGADQHVIDAQ